ncbi:LysR family transcriptional regulator [Comamonas antarctica]|uniref:LysR family transcriptional regulator n=1 Tax=Comamonas antarctica TaxID=2743470 RepID=UPI0028E29992|nr:LysR family transcriptional regulator [Comamonas antarctica]
MQIKWLEDFLMLAQERSFTRAAELRHVTHPAFGRRIRALEAWSGTALVVAGSSPVRLTPAGEAFLETCELMTRTLAQSHEELQTIAGRQAQTILLATGRTLARTIVADWLMRLGPLLQTSPLTVYTRTLHEAVTMLEQDEIHFSLIYHHPAIAVRWDARQFSYVNIASDRLVPVSRANPEGQARHSFAAPGSVPYLAYPHRMALGRLVEDHLSQNPDAPRLQRILECDSADAQYEYVHKGLGVAWLPWSMVHADCKARRLALAGTRNMEVRFDVRMYRAKRRLSAAAEEFWNRVTQR